MNNEQLNVDVAKLCGWVIEDGRFLTSPDGRYIGELGFAFDEFADVLPDYSGDLNAVDRAYRKLVWGDHEQMERYYTALASVINERTATDDCSMFDNCSMNEIAMICVSATSEDRARALLRVCSDQSELDLHPATKAARRQEQIDDVMRNEDGCIQPANPITYHPA